MAAGKVSVGHPVDVASGTMFMERLDGSLAGTIDLFWERYYSTALASAGISSPIGPGWTTVFFATLTRSGNEYHFVGSEGEIEVFVDEGELGSGGVIRKLGSCRDLARRDDRLVVTGWDVDDGEIERYYFEEQGEGIASPLVRFEESIIGHGLDTRWDRGGRLIEVRQTIEQRAFVFDYNGRGLIEQVSFRLPDGGRMPVVQYQYDAEGRMTAAVDASGRSDRYEYDAAGRVTRERLRDGGDFVFRYDERGRCVFTSGQDNYDVKVFRYLDVIQWTEVSDSHGRVSRYHFNNAGQVTTEVNALGATRRTSYDEYGRMVTRVDPLGATTAYEYDDRGNRTTETDALGHASRYEYNDSHEPITSIDANGHVWRNAYNERNQIVETIDPLGRSMRAVYDARGLLVRVIDRRGAEVERRFSINADLVEETDWAGNTTRYEVDVLGRVISETGPDEKVTRYEYDVLNRPTAVIHPDGTRLNFVFDAGDNVINTTNARGEAMEFRYLPCHRLLQVRDALGHQLDYEWGTEPDELLRIINEKGEVYSFEYDAAGQSVYERGFDGRELRLGRDLVGRIVQTTNNAGAVTQYRYDAAGELSGKTLPDGQVFTYAYDNTGELIAAENPDCRVECERDALGRIVRERQGAHTVETGYDENGNAIALRSDFGADVECRFDPNDLVVGVNFRNRAGLLFQRDSTGEEMTRFLPRGGRLEQVRRPSDLLVRQRLDAPAGTLLDREFTYDAIANPVEVNDARWGRATYTYDAEDRLVRATRNGSSEVFVYDPAANMVERGGERNRAKDFTYAAGSRVVGAGAVRYEYDLEGHLVRKIEPAPGQTGERIWQFRWDGHDQLRELITPSGEQWMYKYDAFGRRIAKTGPGGTTEFLWDGDVLLNVAEPNRVTTLFYDPESFSPLCQATPQEVQTFVCDHLGTPRELLGEAGELRWAAVYEPWGRVEAAEGVENDPRVRFPGQWLDRESGLHYTRFRYYDPDHGHFITPDPIGLMGGYNLYQYGWNPITWDDPLGWIHRNSKNSRAKNHVYHITDKNGKTWKYGISGRPLNKNGKSNRAESQVRRLNRQKAPAGFQKPFKAKVIAKGVTRKQALAKEQAKVNAHAKKEEKKGGKFKGPKGNKRPKAKRC